jgi:hypothetical protein
METKLTPQEKRYQSQWASQFFVCAELTRRGYLVSIPLGNAKFTDIHVETLEGKDFRIDVKGLMNKSNNFIFKRVEPSAYKFFIFVYLPQDLTYPEFYILPSFDLMKLRDEFQAEVESKGRDWNDPMAGLYVRHIIGYKDRWDLLPK